MAVGASNAAQARRSARDPVPPRRMVGRIHEVWADNFDEEMARLMAAIEDYPYVAMVGD